MKSIESIPSVATEVFASGTPDLAPADLARAVDDALATLPGDAGRLTILVNDPQRHTSTGEVLKCLARCLGPAAMRVLIAGGSHPAPSQSLREAFERSILGEIEPAAVAWHDSRSGDLVGIGSSDTSREQSDGVTHPWLGHPWLLEADALLAIGSVEPHYFAGWTGAHKTCTIGVASCTDIEANHAHAMSSLCRPAVLDGNPVAEGVFAMLRSLQAARPVAAVDLVQAGDSILAAVGGTPSDALWGAIAPASAAFVRHVNAPVDALIAEVAGPLGESFYQADKGIKNNEWAVRDGGCLVLVAPCPKGIGQDHFTTLLRKAAMHADAVAAVDSAGYRLGDHKAVRLRYLTDPNCRAVRVHVVSEGLSAADSALLGLQKAPTIEAALADAGVRPGLDRVVCVRDAGNVCVLPDTSCTAE